MPLSTACILPAPVTYWQTLFHFLLPLPRIQKWTKLWVVVHSEVSPLDCFLGYCKKESKWLQDNQAIVKYSLNDFGVSQTSTKKHDKVMRLDFPTISMELCFDSQTKLDYYYQLLLGVSSKWGGVNTHILLGSQRFFLSLHYYFLHIEFM